MAMPNDRRGHGRPASSSFILLLLALSLLAPMATAGAAAEECDRQEPNPAERAIGIAASASNGALTDLRSWIRLAAINLRSRRRISRSKSEAMKEAAASSFQTGKTAAEESAKSAATVAETVVKKAVKKVKKNRGDL
ncbi:uncharacterized protein LOC144706186 isoform X1 [Wolffia australiana]